MSEDQLQPEDTLEDLGHDDVLDEGITPPDEPRGVDAKGVTTREQVEGETLEERLLQEEPEEWTEAVDEAQAEISDADRRQE